jgi:hypothetical protein
MNQQFYMLSNYGITKQSKLQIFQPPLIYLTGCLNIDETAKLINLAKATVYGLYIKKIHITKSKDFIS